MKQAIAFVLGAGAITVLGNQAINFLNQPSTLSVGVGASMIVCCGLVVYAVGDYVVKSIITKAKNEQTPNDNAPGGSSSIR